MVLTELKVVASHTCTCGQATIRSQEMRFLERCDPYLATAEWQKYAICSGQL